MKVFRDIWCESSLYCGKHARWVALGRGDLTTLFPTYLCDTHARWHKRLDRYRVMTIEDWQAEREALAVEKGLKKLAAR